MIYVMSDLHGCYEEYIKMLNLINFNDNDTLYILGDICDRGPLAMKIILHMMEHENIVPIFGNHDVIAFNALSKIGNYSKEVLIDKNFVLSNCLMNGEEYREYLYWLADGGKSTLKDYDRLSASNKRKVLEYLSDFKYYDEINIKNNDYVLVHGGLSPFDVNKELYEYKLSDIINERTDINKIYFKDKVIIFGHTPTKFYDANKQGKIIKKNNNIAIDCGCVFGYGLGCLCLDNMQEYYI